MSAAAIASSAGCSSVAARGAGAAAMRPSCRKRPAIWSQTRDGGCERIERGGPVADRLEIGDERTAVGAVVEMPLELGAPDRSDRAVDQVLD